MLKRLLKLIIATLLAIVLILVLQKVGFNLTRIADGVSNNLDSFQKILIDYSDDLNKSGGIIASFYSLLKGLAFYLKEIFIGLIAFLVLRLIYAYLR